MYESFVIVEPYDSFRRHGAAHDGLPLCLPPWPVNPAPPPYIVPTVMRQFGYYFCHSVLSAIAATAEPLLFLSRG